MSLQQFDGLEIPAPADFHVHLRDGPMMELVTPTIRQGGVNTVFVMVSNQLRCGERNKNLNSSAIKAQLGASNHHGQTCFGLQEKTGEH